MTNDMAIKNLWRAALIIACINPFVILGLIIILTISGTKFRDFWNLS